MRTLKPLSVLTASSTLQCLACRNGPIAALRDLRTQTCSISDPNSLTAIPRRLLSTQRHSQATPVSSPCFTYRIGSSFSGKGQRFKPKEDIFSFDPEKDKEIYTGRPKSGQDAFFVSNVASTSDVAFGVADGVGGWSDSGIDSAHFSHGLCREMATIAKEPGADGKGRSPRAILQDAYNKIVEEEKIEGGGSTACVAVGGGNGNLQVAKCVYNGINYAIYTHACSV